jgi:beta-fructofuranosidase
MWECPDFFALGKKHVLLYSTERKVYWESGDLDPKELVFHSQKRGLLDLGAFYAPKSQLDAKGQRILWGWITETRPEAEFSAAGWAGCMSLPRLLSLDSDGELMMQVLPTAQQLRGKHMAVAGPGMDSASTEAALTRVQFPSATAEIELRAKSRPFELELTDGRNAIVHISFDPARTARELQIGKDYANLHSTIGADLKLNIFVDGSVVECMIDGRVAWTTRTYQVPGGPLHLAVPKSEIDSIVSLDVWPIQPISADRLTT